VIYCTRGTQNLQKVKAKLQSVDKTGQRKFVVFENGHRDGLCSNPEISHYTGPKLDAKCRQFKPTCSYFKNLADIEDLHSIAAQHKLCQFYLKRNHVLPKADVVIMPFACLLDDKIELDLENCVVMIEDAQNTIQRESERIFNFDVDMELIDTVINELEQLKALRHAKMLL
jgi:hypothetical protein